jgi:hypothetical protein
MSVEADALRFRLRLVTKPRVKLRATELSVPIPRGEPDIVKASEGKAGGCFEWREGTQALCVCLLRFLCYPKEQLADGIAFVFDGEEQSPAKTLDGVISKANKANSWASSMFGSLENGRCRLRQYMIRRRPKDRGKPNHYEVEIQHRQLPQESITFEVDGHQVTDIPSLESLADRIEDQWYEITGNASELSKIKAARTPRSKGDAAGETEVLSARSIQSTATPAAEPDAASETQPATATAPLRPLAEVFRSLSVASIKAHIVAALMPGRGSEAIEASMAELLSPECVNVMAEKLTSESTDTFCQFYSARYDDSQNIKRSIAGVIASHPELCKKLAATVAKAGFSDMKDWFITFSNFCDRAIFYDLEQALNVGVEEPGFKEKFLPYAPERLPSLIEYFSRHGLVCAVRIFEKINQEGKELYGD